MNHYHGKVCWITGASSGIGAELARQLSDAGASLILSARREAVLDELKKSLNGAKTAHVLRLDLENTDALGAKVEEAYTLYKRIDYVFHNAGVSQRSYVMETELAVDRKIMEVNYFGTVALTKLILPKMIAGGGGHFAVVSSVVGKFGYGVRSAYSASKHALHGFFESLYLELNHKNIGITLICPGPVQTDISLNALGGDGRPTGEMDEMQVKGLPVKDAVRNILDAVEKEKLEVIIGGFKAKLGVRLRAVWPSQFFRMALKQNPRGDIKI